MATCHRLVLTLLLLGVPDVSSVPMSRDRRSDDPPALQAVVSGLSQQVSQLTAQLTALHTAVSQLHDKASVRVAFNAGIKHREDVHLLQNQVVKFDLVLYNEGSAYDPTTGVFTAPVSGLYVFLVSSRSFDANGGVVLRLDSGQMMFVDAHNAMATGHFVYHLNKGAKAWVAQNVDDGHLYTYNTAFSGFLIKADM